MGLQLYSLQVKSKDEPVTDEQGGFTVYCIKEMSCITLVTPQLFQRPLVL